MGLDRFRSAREQIEKMPSKMEMNPNQYRQKECIQKIGQFTKGLITQKDLINSLKTLNGYEPGIVRRVVYSSFLATNSERFKPNNFWVTFVG